MSSRKVSALDALSNTTEDDALYVVNDQDGTPASKRISPLKVVPQHTTAEMNAISSPAAGMILFNTTVNEPCFYNGTAWVSLVDGLEL